VTTANIEFSDGCLRVRGPLTLVTVEPLLKGARWPLDGLEICVDLSDVTEADSSAVGLLLSWVRDATSSGRRVRFENLPSNLKSLISLYGVGEFIPGA
jgi:phospholipid transport system transporter-binding protein